MHSQYDTFSVFNEHSEYGISALGRSRDYMKRLKIITIRTDYIIKYKLKSLESLLEENVNLLYILIHPE